MRYHLVLTLVLLLPLRGAKSAESVGSETCKGCHVVEHKIFESSGHSRAAESLTNEQRQDGRCSSCHSPKQNKTLGISCETCHGGGKYYSASYVMKDPELSRLVGLTDPSEKTCIKCHDARAPSIKPFQFRERLKKLDHWTKEKNESAKEKMDEVSSQGQLRKK